MSIIERAVGRLGLGPVSRTRRPPAAERAAPATPEPVPETAPTAEFALGQVDRAPETGPRRTTLSSNLDFAHLRAAGLLTPEDERSQLAQELRLIKRPLLTNALGKGPAPIHNGNLIMVASCFPGEGKTYNAINLAMSIAMEMDHRVLLVDADVANPSIPDALGIRVDRGFLDVLAQDHLDLSDVLIKTNVEKLTLLPAGHRHTRPTELLASEAMHQLLHEMAKRYSDRIIVFDSPPLLVTTEARVLASHMGQVVLVVEASKTTQQAVKESLEHLAACPVVGLLLNKSDPLIGEHYYYGYKGKYA